MNALFDVTARTKYYITDTGEVLSVDTRLSEPVFNKKKACLNKKRGYMYVRTRNKNFILHRLVASAFIDNPDNLRQVNHKDGNKLNNSVDNLEWVTAKENIQHAINRGLITKPNKNEGVMLKYTNGQCREVLDRVHSGMTYIEAGSIFNMPYSTVAHLVRGSRRRV